MLFGRWWEPVLYCEGIEFFSDRLISCELGLLSYGLVGCFFLLFVPFCLLCLTARVSEDHEEDIDHIEWEKV